MLETGNYHQIMCPWLQNLIYKILLLIIIIPSDTYASELKFNTPIQCKIGEDCFLLNQLEKVGCGQLPFSTKDGVMFIAKHDALVRDGIKILASQNGKVKAVRSNVDDQDKSTVSIAPCGNGIIVTHANGYETQYCYLHKDTIKLKKGDKVKEGQELGLMGMSGNINYPAMLFTLKRKNKHIDPFTNNHKSEDCVYNHDKSLWNPETIKTMIHSETIITNYGFTTEEPEIAKARNGDYNTMTIAGNTNIIGYFIDLIGVYEGDLIIIEMLSPDGYKIVSYQKKFVDFNPRAFAHIVYKNQSQKLNEGEYKISFKLLRQGSIIIEKQDSLNIREY